MSLATPIAAVGILLCGRALHGLLPRTRERSRLEVAGVSLLLGLSALPAYLVLRIALLGPIGVLEGRLTLAIGSALGLLAIARDARGAGCPRPGHAPERWSVGQLVLALAATLFACFACFYASSMPMHVFDPIYHFAYKGKLLWHEGFGGASWVDLEGAVGRVITHPDYPPGLPALHVLAAAVAGAFDEDVTRGLCALYVLAPAALLYAGLRARGRTPALAGALAWLALPLTYYTRATHEHPLWALVGLGLGSDRANAQFAEHGPFSLADGWILDGAADLPLAALLFGACFHLARLVRRGPEGADAADAWLGGLCLGGVLLIKNEGLALAPLLCVAVVGARLVLPLGATPPEERAPFGRLAGRLLCAVGTALLLSATWFWLRQSIPSIDEAYPERMTPAGLARELDRAREVAGGFLGTFVAVQRWSLVWPLFFATLFWALARPRRLCASAALPALLLVLAAFGLYFAILLVTPWELAELFPTVIPGRLLLHVTPAALFATMALLWSGSRGARPAE